MEKTFFSLKTAEIAMGWGGGGGELLAKRNDSGHKNSFFLKVKPIFQGYISEFNDSFHS